MSDAKTSAEDAADLADEEEAIEAANERNFPAVGDTDDEDDRHDAGTLEVLPPRQPMNLGVLETLRDHVSAMRDAKFFADGMCYSALVPERFRNKPGDGAAAILFGAELGLSPIASLRSIIVIHGSPGLEARTMKALLKGKGYRFVTHESTTDVHDIEAWSPDGSEHERARWTIDDALRAGYVPKPSSPDSELRPEVQSDWVTVTNRAGKTSVAGNMKYITDPKAMLKAKATAEVCRDIAPHILLGLPYAAEELEDFDDDGDTVPVARPPRRARGVGRLRERAAEAKHEEPVDAEEEPDPQFVVGKGWTAGEGGKGWVNAVTDPAVVQRVVDAVNAGQSAPPAPPEAAAEPAPEPAEPAAAKAEPAPSPEQPAPASTPGDIPMSMTVRAKGEALMARLLDVAKVEGDDRLAVVAEIAAKQEGATYHAVDAFERLTNAELKYVVDTLIAWDGNGKLYDYCGEALNNASLREAGMLEGGDA